MGRDHQGLQFLPDLLREVAHDLRSGSSEHLIDLRPRQGPVGGSSRSSTPASQRLWSFPQPTQGCIPRCIPRSIPRNFHVGSSGVEWMGMVSRIPSRRRAGSHRLTGSSCLKERSGRWAHAIGGVVRHASKACALCHRRVGCGGGCCGSWECGGYGRG